MFEQVTVHAADLAASEAFYETVLTPLGLAAGAGDFSLAQADDEHPVTRGLHIGFRAPAHDLIHAFWDAGTAAGYQSDGEPGPRTIYGPDYYGSFLLDPDGNSAEAAFHDNLRTGGTIDHLWIRVADFAQAKAFYDGIAATHGFRLAADEAKLARYTSGDGSFTILEGVPKTENVDVAFEIANR